MGTYPTAMAALRSAYLPAAARVSTISLVAASLAAGAMLAGGAYSFAGPWLHNRGGDDRHEGITASVFA